MAERRGRGLGAEVWEGVASRLKGEERVAEGRVKPALRSKRASLGDC